MDSSITTKAGYTVLHGFENINGANPQAGLILGTDGRLYGTIPPEQQRPCRLSMQRRLFGIAGCAGPVAAGAAIDTAASGAHAFTVAAADQAGNQAAVTHSFSVAAVPVVLNVNRTGQGGVISDPAGINCGSRCRATFARGVNVVLTATPAAGRRFAGWSGGGCSGTGACTVTMNRSTQVRATFR